MRSGRRDQIIQANRRPDLNLRRNANLNQTHVALGLGLAACQKGPKVRFTTAAAQVHELIEAADERRLQRLQKLLASQDLLIIPSCLMTFGGS